MSNESRLCFRSYNFKSHENIIAFFNNFDEFLCEEALWQISESIKPRGKKTNVKWGGRGARQYRKLTPVIGCIVRKGSWHEFWESDSDFFLFSDRWKWWENRRRRGANDCLLNVIRCLQYFVVLYAYVHNHYRLWVWLTISLHMFTTYAVVSSVHVFSFNGSGDDWR